MPVCANEARLLADQRRILGPEAASQREKTAVVSNGRSRPRLVDPTDLDQIGFAAVTQDVGTSHIAQLDGRGESRRA